jgi:hypothetical protein
MKNFIINRFWVFMDDKNNLFSLLFVVFLIGDLFLIPFQQAHSNDFLGTVLNFLILVPFLSTIGLWEIFWIIKREERVFFLLIGGFPAILIGLFMAIGGFGFLIWAMVI